MKTLFFEIEPFEIFVLDMKLKVVPMEDGVYRVFYQGELLADLYPEISANGILWNGFGVLPGEVVSKIGDQICAFENMTSEPKF